MNKRENYIKSNGITLIALVITIIIMLILAGVSLNATIGDNGILTQAQYSTFVSEMSDIEEALKIWQTSKMLDDEDYEKKAPTDGLCTPEELQQAKRLMGEVGYYRVWSISESKPTLDLTETSEVFDDKYEGEFVYYPAGVQDLYYLNNEKLGINKKKKYLIDASTGIIYSVKGIALKGIQCYSLEMAKTVMQGYTDMPSFAELEIRTGKNAGNISNKYQVDENGNYILDENGNKIENPDYNPYGFQIIASEDSNNIYKLYNNGDLYAKGIKGTQINTNVSEMEKIDSNKWSIFTVPSDITNCKKIYKGQECVYFLTENGDLYALGKNECNKFGLSQEEQKSFTGREVVKIDINNKKIKNVFDNGDRLFIITIDNELYACGYNNNYELGLGHNNEVISFQKIDVNFTQEILEIHSGEYFTVIRTNNNEFYGSGNIIHYAGVGESGTVKNFIRIYDGYGFKKDGNYYVKSTELTVDNTDFDQNITEFLAGQNGIMFRANNKVYLSGRSFKHNVEEEEYTSGDANKIFNLSDFLGMNIKIFGMARYSIFLINDNNEMYAYAYNYNIYDLKNFNEHFFEKVDIPNIDIKEAVGYATDDSKQVVYLLDTSGGLYGISYDGTMLGTEGNVQVMVRTSCPEIESLSELGELYEDNKKMDGKVLPMFLGKDGNIYSINEGEVLFRNNILQSSWIKIASDVKKVSPGLNSGYGAKDTNSLAIVKNDGTLWTCGEDSGVIGLATDGVKKISNLTQVTNEIISNNVIDAQLSDYQLYVLTDDRKLYSTGYYSTGIHQNWPEGRVPGWEEKENHFDFVEILDKVKMFDIGFDNRIAVTDDGVYVWGINWNGCIGSDVRITPSKINISDKLDVDEISSVYIAFYCGAIVMKNGDVYLTANPTTDYNSNNSLSLGKYDWNKRENLQNIVSVIGNNSAAILQSSNGELYGWGRKKLLGMNTISAESVFKETKLNVNNVSSIVAGNDFLIAITKDGKVYGTGSNLYGILGRWIGVDRKTPNSRYKTAFEWVECPELEI